MAYVASSGNGGGKASESYNDLSESSSRFVPTESYTSYGYAARNVSTGSIGDTTGVVTQVAESTAMAVNEDTSFENGSDYEFTAEEMKRMRVPTSVYQDKNVQVLTRRTAWQNASKRNEMLNENTSQIQNGAGFPYYSTRSSGMTPARYDYQIIPGDTRYKSMATLEDKLKAARASFGIQVHGSNDIGRAVKYYMYNRFKVPDTNLAFNKMTTHVFFTRPDLNLLRCGGGIVYGANSQVLNHTDTALLYRMNPYIFKLLTDRVRCGDSNNFNMLLSQQVASFTIEDEELNAMEVGKSWSGNSMYYGDQYTGKGAGSFRCSFTELQDLSVIKLLKLWITYIDNVSKGAWSPSYDLNGSAMISKYGSYTNWVNSEPVGSSLSDSYVYSKTLDYAASVYVLKCDPTGQNVLYWTKYFGVFPTNTGVSALSWDSNNGIGDSPKLDITFKYCFKKDLSPISLFEFNDIAGVADLIENGGTNSLVVESSFNPNYNHSSRPFVGAPFVEFSSSNPDAFSRYHNIPIGANADIFGKNSTTIKLKFLKEADSKLSDDLLYRSSLANR